MKLKSTVIKNYRGIKEETLVSFQDFNCIVGKNDVGKSTLLKAIDAFLNENNPNIEDKNVYSDSNFIEKINQVVPEDEQVEAQVEFDWSKLISTSFRCKKDEANIPLTSRGDGFRRITMMSYFEMLAEEKHSGRDMLFGFEEPETFLHPETQQQLYSKLIGMKDNGYQILVTTHSPNIVAESNIEDLIFIQRIDGKYTVRQLSRIDIYQIIEELGIKRNSALLNVFGDIKVLFLLEGIDDVGAFNTLAREYKKHGDIEKTFDELGVLLIPVGGCGAIKHWADLQIIRKMHKPYYILLDSDKLRYRLSYA